MLGSDDLHLHLVILLIPCTQQSKTWIMPSGIATWQVRRIMEMRGYGSALPSWSSHIQVQSIRYTHTQAAYSACVHAEQHTSTGRSHQMKSPLLSTRESKGEAYITFFEPNPSSFIDRQLGKSSDSKNTRTGRTHSQNPHPGAALAKNCSLLRSKPWSRSSSKLTRRSRASQTNHQKQNLYTNTHSLGAGVRYTQKNLSKHMLCSSIGIHMHHRIK